MEDNSVIIYRSQTEKNQDFFINEVLFPWIYEHFWALALVIVVLIIIHFLTTKKSWTSKKSRWF